MGKSSRRKNNAPPPAPAAAPLRHRRRWWVVPLLIAFIWWGGHRMFLRPRDPALPHIPTDDLSPAAVAQIEKAVDEARQAARSGDAWGRLGMVLHAYDLKAEARVCYARAGELQNGEARWPYLHGVTLINDDPEAALAMFLRASAQSNGRNDFVRLRAGQLLTERGRLDEAVNQFEELLAPDPRHIGAHLGLGRIEYSRGRLAESKSHLDLCLGDPRAARSASTLLAGILRRLGQPEAAERAAILAASLPPDQPWFDVFSAEVVQFRADATALSDRAARLLELGQTAEALALVGRLTNEFPGNVEAWLLLGRARYQQKDCPGAEQAFRRALVVEPASVNGHFQLGLTLLCQERYADAAASLEQAIRFKADFGAAHFNLGFALARAGRGRDAIPHFRNAIRFNPDHVESHLTLADLLNQLGQKDEAMTLLRRARSLSPGDERVQVLMERVQGGR